VRVGVGVLNDHLPYWRNVVGPHHNNLNGGGRVDVVPGDQAVLTVFREWWRANLDVERAGHGPGTERQTRRDGTTCHHGERFSCRWATTVPRAGSIRAPALTGPTGVTVGGGHCAEPHFPMPAWVASCSLESLLCL